MKNKEIKMNIQTTPAWREAFPGGHIGALLLGSMVCLTASVIFAGALPRLRQMIRPIYIEKGIVKEMAKGIQAATDMTVPPED